MCLEASQTIDGMIRRVHNIRPSGLGMAFQELGQVVVVGSLLAHAIQSCTNYRDLSTKGQ